MRNVDYASVTFDLIKDCDCEELNDCKPRHFTMFLDDDPGYFSHLHIRPTHLKDMALRMDDYFNVNALEGFILHHLLQKDKQRKGRSLSWDADSITLYKSIFKHNPKEQSVKAFCRQHNISEKRYRRIRDLDLTSSQDVAKLLDLKKKILGE